MKKSFLIKGASLLLALTPVAALASCNSGSKVPSRYETIGLGDLWVSKANPGKSFDFKVTLQDVNTNYNVLAGVITGNNPDEYDVETLISYDDITVVDQYGNDIATTEIGSFSPINSGDVYFHIQLKDNEQIKDGKHLGFITTQQYYNDDGSEVFDDIDLCNRGKFVSFGCYLNQGIPCIFTGANIIDKKFSPIFSYQKLTDVGVTTKYGYLERKTDTGEDDPYFIGYDWDSEKELVLEAPTLIVGIAKLSNVTELDDKIEITTMIDLSNPLVSTFCFADIQKGETVFFRQNVEEKKTYDVIAWGKDPATDYTQTFAPLAVYNYDTGDLLDTVIESPCQYVTPKGCNKVLMLFSNNNHVTGSDIYITHVFNRLDGEKVSLGASGTKLTVVNDHAGKYFHIYGNGDKPLVTLTDAETPVPAEGKVNLNSNFELTVERTLNADLIAGSEIAITYINHNERRPIERTIKEYVDISNFYLQNASKTTTTNAIDRTALLDAFGIIDDDTIASDIEIKSLSINTIDGISRTKQDCKALGISPDAVVEINLGYNLI